MRPPVQTEEAFRGPEGHPNKARLTGLTGTLTPGACSAMMASTMLFFGPAPEPNAGTPEPNALPMKERMPSYPAKKKSLSFTIGPPTTPPNCFNCVGSLSHDAGSDGLDTQFPLPSGPGLKILRASKESSRPNAYAAPCRLLVPERIPTLTTAPGFQPYSAFGFSSRLNSWMASMGRIVSPSVMKLEAPVTGRASYKL